jgi:predicted TIM-barrel fold metal-dependent hydrolase
MMATDAKALVIDADTHVIETEETWEYLEPSERKYRPVLAAANGPDPATGGVGTREYWVIDGRICGFRFPTLSEQQLAETSKRSGRNVSTPQQAREVENVAIRLRHMDELGIDKQVLYNTLFIAPVTSRTEIEVALCGAWNRWMAEVWKMGGSRLAWSCVPPYLSIPDALDQIREAKKHGAVAVSLRPIEGTRFLVDPYFHPIYEEAQKLGLPIAVHISNGNQQYCDAMRSPHDPGQSFGLFRIPTVVACHALMLSEVPTLFPRLRWGFIETAAQWVPWVIQEAESRAAGQGRKLPENLMEAYNIWVTLQTDDDIDYLVRRCGDRHFMIGTDYGHLDPSSNIDAIQEFARMDSIGDEVKRRVMGDNPKAFYGL